MDKINRAPKGVRRLVESKHNESRAGRGHAEHFGKTGFPTRQIPQTIADGDDVEGIVGKGNLLRITRHEFQIRDGRFQMARGGDLEHFFAEVESGGFRAAIGEGKGDVAGAAA